MQPKSAYRGAFITIEGMDGSGKSTLMGLLKKRLHKAGVSVWETREPGGTPLGDRLRTILLSVPMNPMSELFLLEAARAAHCNRIRANLDQNTWVLCDRFSDSTLAYQGGGRKLPWKVLQWLNTFATQELKPDLTFFLDFPIHKSVGRATVKNRFEKEKMVFHRGVQQGFRRAIREDKKRFVILKVAQFKSKNALADHAFQILLKKFSIYEKC